ncbi:hypothetical protein AVEN_186910-1 [Araneus ventricosus]|uniref:Uncharacterized protein n=1 Tax=Araneus ventricosus TaxID=182803 RepID=A0A4Y2NBE1_ARAVE|nr:hypothetical protein AVEN_186910-1 [Araneus ventricosus]
MSDARKGKNKKGKSGSNSESSTPQSSPQSGEDEKQQLLQSGAYGSSDSRKSRSAEKTKAPRTSPGKLSPYGSPSATSSRNSPQYGHSSETDLDVSDQEGGTCGQRASRNPLELLKEVLSRKTKSPNRSSDPDCSCKDKKNHQPECSKLKNIASDAEGKSTKISAKESKPQSSYASQIIAKRTEGRTQSSTSPDPRVVESFGEATEKQPLLQSGAHGSSCSRESRSTYKTKRDSRRTGLGKRVPYSSLEKSPERSEDYQSSPSKKSRSSPWGYLTTLPRNLSSDTEDSCDDKTDQESGTKGKSPNRSQTRSEAYSSSSSPFCLKKNKRRDASNVSPENSRRSKSSSTSDANVESKSTKISAKDKGNRSNKSKSNAAASSIPMDYDPQEGTSRGPAIFERIGGHSSGDDMEIEDDSEDFIPIIEEQRGSRHRTKSCKSCLRPLEPVTTRERSPRRFNFRDLRIQLGKLEWSWLDELRRPRNANAERRPTAHHPDENERGLLRRVETIRHASSGVRNQSLSPGLLRRCNCQGAEEGRRVIVHEIGCPYICELRRRKRRKKCRQDVQPEWDPKDD